MKRYHVVCMAKLPGVKYSTIDHCSMRHHWSDTMKSALEQIRHYMEMEGTFEVRLREEKDFQDKDDVRYE